MKYAVLYQSRSGNTEKLANAIYKNIEDSAKIVCDMDEINEVPYADVYFVGFPIHDNNCSMRVIECLEEIENGHVALFATCGLLPTENYKKALEKSITLWMPDEADYMGMYLCQGATEEKQQICMIHKMEDSRRELSRMFEIGDLHPDKTDLREAADFANEIQNKVEAENERHFW